MLSCLPSRRNLKRPCEKGRFLCLNLALANYWSQFFLRQIMHIDTEMKIVYTQIYAVLRSTVYD
jgi:hypothetical protein